MPKLNKGGTRMLFCKKKNCHISMLSQSAFWRSNCLPEEIALGMNTPSLKQALKEMLGSLFARQVMRDNECGEAVVHS